MSTNYVYGTGQAQDRRGARAPAARRGRHRRQRQALERVLRRSRIREGALLLPFRVTETEGRYSASVLVAGGGVSGQIGAIRHGIARALLSAHPDARAALREAGLLTRDPRAKERKKYGLKRARKAPQYTKR